MIATSLGFVMGDGMERIEPRAWRALLVSTLARSGEGIVVCDGDLDVVFSNPRAAQLLERLGGLRSRRLPASLASVVTTFHGTGDGTLSTRVIPEKGSTIHVEVAAIRGAPPVRTVLWLREDTLRDEHLYAVLSERYGFSRRSFQLAQLLRQGLTNRDIARELRLTEATVKAYLHDLYRACGVGSRTALIALVEQYRNQK